ncbi:membrane protein insertase YidC [Evansella halocellulosilytica]|uniref:membrane protein insertase YidC n=1 Tax=Evansella halocellulosilytica TaxID=2011013 RepID=UPI000BB8E3CC|nr:membrane protein insertase YidC [Evansella halocellulosilytica]
MEQSSVFTFFKRFGILAIIVSLLFLSGCQASSEPIDANTAGVFNHYVVYPFSYLIKFFASLFDGNYGLSIILMTLIIRVALMPLMMKQYKNQTIMREKMSVIQPEMNDLKEKYKDKKDPESQQKFQREMMQLYQKHNFNPIASMGCLPMLIQFPILIGFYYAIMRTPEIAEHSFLWFSLGDTDFILPFIAGAVYLVQFKISQIGMDSQQQKQLAVLGYITPVIMGIFSFSVPAALPLYWSVGGLFLILQTLISKAVYKQGQTVGETVSQK